MPIISLDFLRMYSGWLSAVALLAGCSMRRPIASIHEGFRLQAVTDSFLLLTPVTPKSNSGSTFQFTIAGSRLRDSSAHRCSVKRGDFSLSQAKNNSTIQVTLPGPQKWLNDLENQLGSPEPQGVEALYQTVADIDSLNQEGCFVISGITTREALLQSLPMMPSESLFNYYGYLPGRTSLDLKPGMRLRIDRAYFDSSDGHTDRHNERRFLGVSDVYFDVAPAGDRQIRFKRLGDIHYNPTSLARRVQTETRDLDITLMPRERCFRLLFKTYLVSQDHTRLVAIIGGHQPSQLDALEKQFRAHLHEDCRQAAAAYGAVSHEYNEAITVSSEIRVELNGIPKFIATGTKVKEVVSGGYLESLKIQRRFMNSYYDVYFDPRDSHILSLALVGGDRLRWSMSIAASH